MSVCDTPKAAPVVLALVTPFNRKTDSPQEMAEHTLSLWKDDSGVYGRQGENGRFERLAISDEIRKESWKSLSLEDKIVLIEGDLDGGGALTPEYDVIIQGYGYIFTALLIRLVEGGVDRSATFYLYYGSENRYHAERDDGVNFTLREGEIGDWYREAGELLCRVPK